MPGIAAFTKAQMGVENVAGGSTDVPTTVWVGTMGTLKDNLSIVFPNPVVGVLGGTTRSYIPKTGGEVQLEGELTFEQAGYLFNSAFYHVDPTTDASSGKIRTWNVQSLSTDPIATTDLDTMVFKVGDNQAAETARYAFCREFSISGKAGEGLQLSATYETRAPATDTFTAGLTVPTVETILFSTGYLYIDPSSDAAGTTVKSDTLLDMNLKCTTGWQAVDAKSNRTDFSFIKRTNDEMELDLTFEHDASSVAEKGFWRSQSERVIRLTFTGSNLTSYTTTDSAYDTKTFIMDLYGKWTAWDVLSEQDGNNTIKGTFKVAYSTTQLKKATFILVNELATLP